MLTPFPRKIESQSEESGTHCDSSITDNIAQVVTDAREAFSVRICRKNIPEVLCFFNRVSNEWSDSINHQMMEHFRSTLAFHAQLQCG